MLSVANSYARLLSIALAHKKSIALSSHVLFSLGLFIANERTCRRLRCVIGKSFSFRILQRFVFRFRINFGRFYKNFFDIF